ncbi:hypothetical protein [uncultured Endozoicomonas sp.]|uniref:hypothetical protein n=1 Tax=uncultured Endozoicomonas sp. TaxID=432652 RepID=UPI0026053CFF|nr:hypothetical protein [uncultured Endozoicomonas sp.]
MKRYKQAILSNFFVTEDGSGMRHLVEANLDIESRSDHTLCTEVLQSDCQYQVLENQHLPKVCLICSAILDRRISNMPVERKAVIIRKLEIKEEVAPSSQLSLLSYVEIKQKLATSGEEEKQENQPEQFELIL